MVLFWSFSYSSHEPNIKEYLTLANDQPKGPFTDFCHLEKCRTLLILRLIDSFLERILQYKSYNRIFGIVPFKIFGDLQKVHLIRSLVIHEFITLTTQIQIIDHVYQYMIASMCFSTLYPHEEQLVKWKEWIVELLNEKNDLFEMSARSHC